MRQTSRLLKQHFKGDKETNRKKERINIKWLHSHLADSQRIVAPSGGARFFLLATEAFFGRQIDVQFDAVFDQCQVHRKVVKSDPDFGLLRCMNTFSVKPSDVEKRRQQMGTKWIYHPYPGSDFIEEPADLEDSNKRACGAHPLIGFRLWKPQLLWTDDQLRLGNTFRDELTINMLPLANLLLDAAVIDGLSAQRRIALVGLVVASQITANLPLVFECRGLDKFDTDEYYNKKEREEAEHQRAWEVARSDVIRAYLTDGGTTAEEIGLVLHCVVDDGGYVFPNYAGQEMEDDVGRILSTLKSTFYELLDRTLEEASRWKSIPRVSNRILKLFELDYAFLSRIDVALLRLFLEDAMRSAARRENRWPVGNLPVNFELEVSVTQEGHSDEVSEILNELGATRYVANTGTLDQQVCADLRRGIAAESRPKSLSRIFYDVKVWRGSFRKEDEGERADPVFIKLSSRLLWLARAARNAFPKAELIQVVKDCRECRSVGRVSYLRRTAIKLGSSLDVFAHSSLYTPGFGDDDEISQYDQLRKPIVTARAADYHTGGGKVKR
eukprot:Selendium_serpulae@DN6508_c0_g2_i1.p1